MSWPAASCGLILPKNSTLSLMSSVYLTLIPVRFSNASREGRDFSSSLTSMYSVQLEKATVFSLAESSVEAVLGPSRLAGGMPHAVRDARPPTASAPTPPARSIERRLRAPRPLVRLRRIAASCAADRLSGSYCSMRCALSEGCVAGRATVGYRSPKIVRCQSFAATAVLSYITCLTCVYSSKEYADMSFP